MGSSDLRIKDSQLPRSQLEGALLPGGRLHLPSCPDADLVDVTITGLDSPALSLDALAALTAFGEASLIDAIVGAGLPRNKSFSVKELSITIMPGSGNRILSLRGNAVSTIHWPLIEGLIELTSSSIGFAILNPTDSIQRQVSFSVSGTFAIAGVDATLGISFPDFIIYATLETENSLTIGDIFEYLFPNTAQIPLLDILGISNFSLAADPRNKACSLSLRATSDQQLDAGNGITFSLETLFLQMQRASAHMSVECSCRLVVAGIALGVTGSYSSDNQGWLFKGGWGDEEPIDIGHVVAGLLRDFKQPLLLPSVIEGVVLP